MMKKIALITGASSGIGYAIAEALSQEDYHIITAQRRQHDQFETIIADLSDEKAPSMIMNEIIETYGKIDLLVNNAGYMVEENICEASLDIWQKTLQINVTAPFLLIKEAIKFMPQGSNIINIGSIEGLYANPNHSAYAASKAGLHGLTKAVALDAGKYGIRCNAIAPGWIDTPLNIAFVQSMTDHENFAEKIKNLHPVGHTGKPEDIAEMVSFLASDKAGFITGQIYIIDGGRTTQISLP
jgi:meso-butanediol dehydrogenase/(S,S)-butanediol dehydrogenase/diacetyl reductase